MRLQKLFLMVVGLASSIAYAALPDFAGEQPKVSAPEATAVFAGGCFWGVDAVFKHTKGVSNVVSGYSGGSAATAQYMTVGTGDDRARRVGAGHLRSNQGFVRRASESVFSGRA
jgi:hypothetical protein